MFKGDFNQPTCSDLLLVLRSTQGGSCTSSDLASDSPPDKRRCTGLSLDDVRSFHTHKYVLASTSPVIKAMLLRAKELRELQAVGDGISITLVPVECTGSVALLVSPPARQLSDPQLEILELPMEQEELLAFEVLLRSIYSGDLAEEVRSVLSSEQGADVSRVMLLVQVYRLADRLEVCTDPCAEAISALNCEDCESVDDVNCVFSLKRTAPALVEHATIKALLEKCLSQLVARFSNIDHVFYDTTLMEEFKLLDVLSVLAFFDSDNLEVLSENVIVALMSAWMGDDWSDRFSKDQLGAFWRILCLGNLTTSFISNLTAFAPWLPVDLAVLLHVAAWKGYQGTNSMKAASMQNRLQSVHGSSVAWFRDKRKGNAYYEAGVILNGHFLKCRLAEFLTSVQHSGAHEGLHTIRCTVAAVFNGHGFYSTLFVQLVSDGSNKTFVLSIGLEVDTSELGTNAGSRILVDVKARCLLGEQEFCLGEVDDIVDGTHAWEVAKVDALDDFSCLGSYLDEDGSLLVQLEILRIN